MVEGVVLLNFVFNDFHATSLPFKLEVIRQYLLKLPWAAMASKELSMPMEDI
jgi:hypothetical protein